MMARMGFYAGMTIVALVGVFFSSDKKAGIEAAFGSADPVVQARVGDEDIAEARRQAQSTLEDFVSHVQSPQSDEREFAVKFQLKDEGCQVENIWASNLQPTYDGFKAQIAGEPRCGPHRSGDPVSISSEEVVDWGYRKGEVMQGNYTTKVLIATLPEEEQVAARKVLGWN